jgi:hypothetical protein
MKIQGIKLIEPRPSVRGYIKIGRTVKGVGQRGAYTRPEKHDHFEITTSYREEQTQTEGENLELDRELIDRIIALGGDSIPLCGGCDRSRALGYPKGLPQRLPVYLPSDEVETALPHWLAYYRGRARFCHGDGVTAARLTEKKDARGQPVFADPRPWQPCGNTCPDLQARRCKPQGILRLCLGVQQSVGSVYEFRTTSWNSLRSLLGSIEWIRGITGGVIQFLPLFLDLRPITVRPKEGRPSRAWVVALDYIGTPTQLAQAVAGELTSYAQARATLTRLTARIDAQLETPEVAAAVEAEFYSPDQVIDGELDDEGAEAPGEQPAGTPEVEASQDAAGATISEGSDSQDLPEENQAPAPEPGAPEPGQRLRKLLERLAPIAEPHAPLAEVAAKWNDAQIRAAENFAEAFASGAQAGGPPPIVPHFLAGLVAGTPPAPKKAKAVSSSKGNGATAPKPEPKPETDGPGEKLTSAQRTGLIEALRGIGIVTPAGGLAFLTSTLERKVTSTAELTTSDAAIVTAAVERILARRKQPEQESTEY